MNYQKIYENIMKSSMNRALPKETYTERHHIIPRCLGGTDEADNIATLTPREHYIAHWLLTKMYPGDYRLAAAFNNMLRISKNQRRLNSKYFAAARKAFSENHPTKSARVREKISNSVKEYFSKNTHPCKGVIKVSTEYRVCGCGCGESFECKINSKQMYIRGHVSEETKRKTSETMKKFMSNLNKDELRDRMNNSMRNCDHVARGKAISAAKKGKKTNQVKIQGERYAKMTDDEFESFIQEKDQRQRTRLTNIRNRFL